MFFLVFISKFWVKNNFLFCFSWSNLFIDKVVLSIMFMTNWLYDNKFQTNRWWWIGEIGTITYNRLREFEGFKKQKRVSYLFKTKTCFTLKETMSKYLHIYTVGTCFTTHLLIQRVWTTVKPLGNTWPTDLVRIFIFFTL